MSRLTRGGDGCHWSDCWKSHYDCRLVHLEWLLMRIHENYTDLGCLGVEICDALQETIDDIEENMNAS